MPRKYRNYTDQDIVKYAKEVTSIAGLLSCLGLRPAGGNYSNLKRRLQELNVDCAHWTGQAWNKDQRLKDWSQYTKASRLKPYLVKERGHKCESCSLLEWQSQPIPLEIHHIDGDKTNNDKSNLQLLCPNCHALTDNWKNRK